MIWNTKNHIDITLQTPKSDFMDRKEIEIITRSVFETQDLGRKIGSMIKLPVIIAMIGDLGCGKTAFVQGLAQGLDVPSDVYITSPTFTLINEYPARLPLFHVDLYRLETVQDLEDIGLDELLYDQAVLAIEWADKLAQKLLGDYLLLHFVIIDDDYRQINLIAYGQEGINLINNLETRMKNSSTSLRIHNT